ncbi:MAG: dihydroorotate dehydrogenase-like protein [Bacteroidetes bacterium]|nr:dihydroorotate dehydrogenase-like protein [Bacteroidota bacterium]
MANLSVNYLGLKLKNPIIVGASNISDDISNLKRLEDAGASAIVFKSLFEEQIQLENLQMHENLREYENRNAEMTSLFPDIEHAGAEEHLDHLRKAKSAVSIPIIGSLNAVQKDNWVEYAKLIAQCGVDALELNLYHVPKDADKEPRVIIEEQLDIIANVKKAVNIPVSVKLSPFYSNVLHVVARMNAAGAEGFVLFNRLFQPDIDIEKETLYIHPFISNEDDNRLPLRYAGLLYGNINGYICSNTGIYNGKDVVKMLLAGADCTQVVSTLYKNGIDQIGKMLKEIEFWMDSKGYKDINDFRGKVSRKNLKDPFAYRRAQYIDMIMKSDEIFKKSSTR